MPVSAIAPSPVHSTKEPPVSYFIQKRDEIEKVFRRTALPDLAKQQCGKFIREQYLGLNLAARMNGGSIVRTLRNVLNPAGPPQVTFSPDGTVSISIPTGFTFSKYRMFTQQSLSCELPSGKVSKEINPTSDRLTYLKLSFETLNGSFRRAATQHEMPEATQEKISNLIKQQGPAFLSCPELRATGQKSLVDSYFVTFNCDGTIYIQLAKTPKKGGYKLVFTCWDFFREKSAAALVCYASYSNMTLDELGVKTMGLRSLIKETNILKKHRKSPGFPKLFTIERYSSIRRTGINPAKNKVEGDCFEMMIYQPHYAGDLLNLLEASQPPLSECSKRSITESLLQALSELELHGIIHHDVKLDNCLYKWSKKKEIKCVLTDFGLAVDRYRVSSGETRGTGRWHSPEYALKVGNERIMEDSKYDSWGLGLILLYLWRPSEEAHERAGWIMESWHWGHASGALSSLEVITKIAQNPEKYQNIIAPPLPDNPPVHDRLIEKLLQIDPAKRATVTDMFLYFQLREPEDAKEN